MKKRVLALVMTLSMLMVMMPFAQMSVSANDFKTYDELVGSGYANGVMLKRLSFDTAAEFATFNGFNSETMSTTDDVLTLPATTAETAVNKGGFGGFPVGSVLHYKINGFVGSNTKNDTSKPGVIMFYDSAYLLMLPFNDVGGKPSLRGLTADGWKGITDGKIDTTQPFEILVKRVGTTENEVWAKQEAVTGSGYMLLATVNASASANGNYLYLKSGNNQGIKFDYVNLYYNNEASVVGVLKSAMSSKSYSNLSYYRKGCGISDATWTDFNALSNKDAVYAMDTTSITSFVEFNAAFTSAVANQKAVEIGTLTSFEDLIGTGITNGLVLNKLTLDTAAELSGAFPSSDTTNGVLTMPTANTELALNNKTDGFPIGSALHFKVDGFTGTNTNAADRPGIIMYWLDSSSPKVGYYFMLKFKDVNSKPALHFGGTSIQSAFLDTTQPFEVLVKRTATQEVEVYAKQSASADGFMKLYTGAPSGVNHMNQILVRSGNGQSIKLDYLKFYQNNEEAVVGALKNSLNANGHNTLNYYRNACGITNATWADFAALLDKTLVYNMDTSAITTAAEFGTAFTAAVTTQKAAEEALYGGTVVATPSLTKSGDKFVGSVEFRSFLGENETKDALVMVALYGENNKLLYPLTIEPVNVKKGYTLFNVPEVTSSSDVKFAKLFVWEGVSLGTSNLNRICGAVQCGN